MKTFTWFLIFLLALIFAFGYYFYEYIYTPKTILISRLEEENLKLKYDVKDRLDRLYRECKKMKTDSAQLIISQASYRDTQSIDTLHIQKAEPISFAFSVKDLFKGASLSKKGKVLINEFYNQIKDKSFDSLRVIINRRNAFAARRVLNIKKFLVGLGLSKDKVWARLDKRVPRDSVYIKIVR